MSDPAHTSDFDYEFSATADADQSPALTGSASHRPLPTYMLRLLAVVGLCGFFVLTATVLQPQDSSASIEDNSSSVRGGANSSSARSDGAILGRLRGSEHEVIIRAGVDGPTYDLGGLDGILIASQLSYDELSTRLADLTSDVIVPNASHPRMGIVDESFPGTDGNR